MQKKILKPMTAFFLIFVFCCTFPGICADKKTAAEKKKEMEQKIQQSDIDYKSAGEKKLYYDQQANELQEDLDEIDGIIASLDGDIVARNQEIADATQKLKEKENSFDQRLRALQHRGALSYLDVIFGADNFSDLLVRVTYVGNIIDHDKTMINEIAAVKNEITVAKDDLEAKRGEQQAARDLADAQKSKMDEMVQKQIETMQEITSNKELYEKEYKAAIRSMEEEEQKAHFKAAVAPPKQSSGNTSPAPQVIRKSSGNGMIWPLSGGGRVTCQFGYRTDPVVSNHTGMDIAISSGSPIVAADSGTVTYVGYEGKGYGNYLIINHGNGTATLYGHCSKIYVSSGQQVSQGEKVAAVGSTGFSTGPHLHFEVRLNGSRVDPEPYIS